MKPTLSLNLLTVLLGLTLSTFASGQDSSDSSLVLRDPNPQHYHLTARASELDSRVKAHPEINFLIESKSGEPADLQHASVDTRVAPRGKLVIWLMGHNQQLFDRINSYGIHAIRVHYANKWFSICCREDPVGEHCRGNLRLEAATGEDFSDEVEIPKPDGMMERALLFVQSLDKQNPQGGWGYFLTPDRKELRWEDVIMAGSSHGSTTAARFAKHQKVSRVVCFCGPRDQHQAWQSLPSATPENRYFGFSHVLDGGWTGDHYCRSWELMGLHKFGPIVNVDKAKAPYANTRRLITDFDVGGDANRAHSSVQPGSRAKKDKSGKYLHEDVWRYMFTHPVDEVGRATEMDAGCDKDSKWLIGSSTITAERGASPVTLPPLPSVTRRLGFRSESGLGIGTLAVFGSHAIAVRSATIATSLPCRS